jgi:hypothetical protein
MINDTITCRHTRTYCLIKAPDDFDARSVVESDMHDDDKIKAIMESADSYDEVLYWELPDDFKKVVDDDCEKSNESCNCDQNMKQIN